MMLPDNTDTLTLRQRIEAIRVLLRSVYQDDASGMFMRNIAQEQLKMWQDVVELMDMEGK